MYKRLQVYANDFLLYKSKSYGVSAWIFGMIQFFLSNYEMKVLLNGHSSRSFCTNVSVPWGSIIGPTLFLIFIDDLHDVISSQLGIYAHDTTIYSYLDSKSVQFNNVKLAADVKTSLLLTGAKNDLLTPIPLKQNFSLLIIWETPFCL